MPCTVLYRRIHRVFPQRDWNTIPMPGLHFVRVTRTSTLRGSRAFSPDGQLGLLLTVTAIHMMSLGETPLGRFKRSWSIIPLGLVFAALGVVSSIIPGMLTGMIKVLVGVLNVAGGASFLVKRYLPTLRKIGNLHEAPVAASPNAGKMIATQTALN